MLKLDLSTKLDEAAVKDQWFDEPHLPISPWPTMKKPGVGFGSSRISFFDNNQSIFL